MVLDEIIPLHISDIFSQVYFRVFCECVGVDLNQFPSKCFARWQRNKEILFIYVTRVNMLHLLRRESFFLILAGLCYDRTSRMNGVTLLIIECE
jgi:hypothetical protein